MQYHGKDLVIKDIWSDETFVGDKWAFAIDVCYRCLVGKLMGISLQQELSSCELIA